MNESAARAWARANGSPARSAFVQGYEAGAMDERKRIAEFFKTAMPTIAEYAGSRAGDLVAYMLVSLVYPERWTDLYTCPVHGDVCSKQGLDWDCSPAVASSAEKSLADLSVSA